MDVANMVCSAPHDVNPFRMTMAAWVSNELIPGALPVWHP
jgi:hypothetical protein